MTPHPFVTRIRAERALISAVNRIPNLGDRPLAGLSKAAVSQWAAFGMNRKLPQPIRQHIIETLLTVSERLRLGSTASHRGVVAAPPPDYEEIEREIKKLHAFLAQKFSQPPGANSFHRL
jgi:hypothetical protein